ncbi:50S ribosomal protein L13 [Patescibacteria group bacterium]|nr:50S ribosomal protein L13 [Patescibacteria group bacterium]MBU1966730.1 50S ribosomal protein L13 [Patescibacteria group bacterium]MBU2543742.1 50S ribosomal protein L13 [Patescibacteria group bacterium]
MQTYMQKTAQVKRNWHLVDVGGQVLGRIATQIAQKLIGKHKVTYTPHIEAGDFVVVINASDVVLTRNKADKKVYTRHSGFPGGLKEIPFKMMLAQYPEKVIELAVKNMLPKNKLRQLRMNRLKVYAGDKHAYESQLNYQESALGKK